MATQTWDFFISHATEDKKAVARPLAHALRRKGFRVWYDEFSLRAGDSLRESIDLGLARSKHGIVILSKAFLRKEWPKRELSGLVSRQTAGDRLLIVPIWHRISKNYLVARSPTLADRLGLSTSITMTALADKILEQFGDTASLGRVAPTGIRELDVALRGGLPRRCSIILQGPKGIGKTTLAVQVMAAALERKEPCLYVTYREAPLDIINRFLVLGAPLRRYVRQKRFRIFDAYSALYGITRDELRDSLPAPFRDGVVYVPNPRDPESYYRLQCRVMEELGFGGVNVIDSANERFALFSAGRRAQQSTRYFQRFRTKLARMGGQTAVHIVSEHIGSQFTKRLSDYQDGVIQMAFKNEKGERRRFLWIETIRETSFDGRRFEFTITTDGVQVIGRRRARS